MATNLLGYLVLLPTLQSIVTGLKITKVDVPRYLMVGQRATLGCHLALEGEVLYSLKWWKDGKQFYQYIPQNKPPAVVFTVDGITINAAKSGLTQVELQDVQLSSSGQYRCEVVAEAPTFNTDVMAANMTILDNKRGPKVTGIKPSYRDGETVTLNCTSHRSQPPAILTWTSGGHEISEDHLIEYPPTPDGEPGQMTSTLGLVLTARKSIFTQGVLKLRCSATIYEYKWNTDVTLHLDNVTYSQPHHLPTLQQTESAAPPISATPGVQLLLQLLLLLHLLLGTTIPRAT